MSVIDDFGMRDIIDSCRRTHGVKTHKEVMETLSRTFVNKVNNGQFIV